MKVTDIIDAAQTYLNAELPDTTVLVSGSESRPLPAVLIEDWSVDVMDGSMNDLIGTKYDSSGNQTAEVYRIPYEARISLLIRAEGSVAGSRLHDAVRRALLKASARSELVSERISNIEVGSGGGVSHQFINPSEAEYTQTFHVTSAETYENTSPERIEDMNIAVEEYIS